MLRVCTEVCKTYFDIVALMLRAPEYRRLHGLYSGVSICRFFSRGNRLDDACAVVVHRDDYRHV